MYFVKSRAWVKRFVISECDCDNKMSVLRRPEGIVIGIEHSRGGTSSFGGLASPGITTGWHNGGLDVNVKLLIYPNQSHSCKLNNKLADEIEIQAEAFHKYSVRFGFTEPINQRLDEYIDFVEARKYYNEFNTFWKEERIKQRDLLNRVPTADDQAKFAAYKQRLVSAPACPNKVTTILYA